MANPNRLPADKRDHERSLLSRSASFLLDQERHGCKLNNISIGGAALTSRVKPEPGSLVVLMIEAFDPLPARVTRALVDGFAVEFELPPEERERISDKLLYLSDLDQFF